MSGVKGLEGAVLGGRFRVDVQVAEGGFGVVFRGVNLELNDPVAIKFFRTDRLSPAQEVHFRQKFDDEIQRLTELRGHANIVRILGRGVLERAAPEQPIPWMALEWLDGPTLAKELTLGRGTRIEPRAAYELLAPVLDALTFVHAERVAHCDLSPRNLVFAQVGLQRQLKVIDFGIAKLLDPPSSGRPRKVTEAIFRGKSLSHAAPEQFFSKPTDARTDVYALGIILTEMLTNQRAFSEDELRAREVGAWDPRVKTAPTPKRFGVDVGAWERVISRAVESQPDARFQTAGELSAALWAALPNTTPEEVGGGVQARWGKGTAKGVEGDRTRPATPAALSGEGTLAGVGARSMMIPVVVALLMLSVGLVAGALLGQRSARSTEPVRAQPSISTTPR